ncbi:AraC family transcriptional regulator [bacterium]|nr:AraC family transcriptional regulator [bacterium]
MTSDTRLTLLPTSSALFTCAGSSPFKTATRFSGNNAHDFILLVLPQEATRKIYGDVAPLLKKNLGMIRRWSPREQFFYQDFLEPPVPETAQRAWFLAKTLEILSLYLFHKPQVEAPLFCSMVKSRAHRYIKEALTLLQSRLALPLDLKSLSQDVGCAPHYLSRLVKQETDKTLSLHLRALRIEKAAELLSTHQLNVTEVAFEVGYQSLSHFSKAFAQTKLPPCSRPHGIS